MVKVEAIATPTLVELEREGYHVIPTANATFLTMNRKGIRQLAHETLGLPTSNYRFAGTREEFDAAIAAVGTPCVVKPIMSSSGHGQSVCKTPADADRCWAIAQEGGRAGAGEVIVEGFVKFDYEITLLTVRHAGGTTFLNPIGHHQVDGDYREAERDLTLMFRGSRNQRVIDMKASRKQKRLVLLYQDETSEQSA